MVGRSGDENQLECEILIKLPVGYAGRKRPMVRVRSEGGEKRGRGKGKVEV